MCPSFGLNPKFVPFESHSRTAAAFANIAFSGCTSTLDPNTVAPARFVPSGVPSVRKLVDYLREVNSCPDMQIMCCGGIYKRAEGLAKVLSKGSSLYVQGSLRTSSYDNREGQKVWKTEVVVQNVILTGGSKRNDHADSGGEAREPEPQRGEPLAADMIAD